MYPRIVPYETTLSKVVEYYKIDYIVGDPRGSFIVLELPKGTHANVKVEKNLRTEKIVRMTEVVSKTKCITEVRFIPGYVL